MIHSSDRFPKYVQTAGKITVVTALAGFCVFMFAFMFDFNSHELSRVSAQSASTTLTVLNTPPQFLVNPYESPASATSTPTNSGDVVTWKALAEDSNSAPYFLLICSTNATPTANAAPNPSSLGTVPPTCSPTSTFQWAVSTSTNSGAYATVSTTTAEAGLFGELNYWYAWVCDDDPNNPRCNSVGQSGPTSTPNAASSSPFHMNYRPQIINAYNNGPVDPGGSLVFYSTSSDPDVEGGSDEIFVTVCATNANYSSSTNTCTDYLASSTIGVSDNASTTYSVPSPKQDQSYAAYVYVYDEHNHYATGSPIFANFTVNNVAPVVTGGDIILSGSTTDDLVGLAVTVENGETPSSSIKFRITDANSCVAASTEGEIKNFEVSVFRSGIGSSSCAVASDYNPNHCYTSTIGTTSAWKLSCTASSTCANNEQDYMDYNCTFPLWFVADPTDDPPGGGNPYSSQVWSASVRGIDDDFATGTAATTTNAKELTSFPAIDILAADIAYGSLEPGGDTGTLPATSTLLNTGNTGLDQDIKGESMCESFTGPLNKCPTSGTSTIPAIQQWYATNTAYTWGIGPATQLSSTSYNTFDQNAPSTTATSSPAEATTYWGIGVPASISYAGAYTGLNYFVAAVDDDSWQ